MELNYCWNYTTEGATTQYDNTTHEHYTSFTTSHYGFPPTVAAGYWLDLPPDGYRVLISAGDVVASYCHDNRTGNVFIIHGEEITKAEWTPKLHQLANEAEQVARAKFKILREEQLIFDAQWEKNQLPEKVKQAEDARRADEIAKARKQEGIAKLESIVGPVHEFVALGQQTKDNLGLVCFGCLLFVVTVVFVWMMFVH